MRRFIPQILTSLLLATSATFATASDTSFITVGTGDITGVYYPAGGAICRLLNKERERHGIRCAVESTRGSTYNLKALRKRELDLAIVQSDWLFHATRGSSVFTAAGADTDLRSLITLHTEEFTVVVRADSGIESFEDLKGKRVNLGNPESGQRNTMDLVLSELGWTYNDFKVASELQASEMSEALCSGRIDAFIYTVGHPNTSIGEATTFCESRLISLPSSLIQRFSEKYPFYKAGKIKGGIYRGNPSSVETFQLSAIFVTHRALPDHIARELTKVIYENFDQFRGMHPALNHISKTSAFENSGRLAPMHNEAKKYLNEQK